MLTVGGFLGAGKTTLVNHLLRNSDGQRIVVFVNDFGAINIDYDLVEAADTDRISLANGCVCCSLNEDLITSIVEFCKTDPPDAFVIEASGVADPRALDRSILSLQSAGYVQLGQRIYVLDAEQFGALSYVDTEEIIDHSAACDLVVLNKSDRVDEAMLCQIETLLEKSAPYTDQMRARYCELPLEILLTARHDLKPADGFQTTHGDAAARFESFALSEFPPLPKERFLAVLEQLKTTALRAKGVVYFDTDPKLPIRFDHVGRRATFQVIDQTVPSKLPAASFVAIGWRGHLRQSELEHLLMNATPIQA